MKKTVKTKLGITKAQAKAWKRGMETANALDLEDAKRMTPAERFESLLQLMHFALSVPDKGMRFLDEDQAARRWKRLHRAYASRKSSA